MHPPNRYRKCINGLIPFTLIVLCHFRAAANLEIGAFSHRGAREQTTCISFMVDSHSLLLPSASTSNLNVAEFIIFFIKIV